MSTMLTKEEINNRAEEARELVRSKARYSALAAALPIPLLDVGTDMKMMNEINDNIEEIFGIEHEDITKYTDDMKTRAAVMASSVVGEFVARKSIGFAVNKISKKQRKSNGQFGIIPIATQGTTALISYFLMKKLGDDHIEKCVSYLNAQIVDGSMQES
ncbi:YcjF family protein [Jeotgalicoccus huakuii]|nr:YcjF family protein [Jeotgalicoccus huakuii]